MPTADYLTSLRRRNLSPATIRSRAYRLGAIERDVGSLLELTAEQIETALDRRKLRPVTRYGWISNLHSFYAWAIRNERATIDPTTMIDRPRLPQYLPRPIGDDDLAHAIGQAHGAIRAWLVLAAYAGLRCCEIATLDGRDVLPADGLLRVHGKGGKDRLIPMHPTVADAIGHVKSGPVFVDDDGEAFTPRRVSDLIGAHMRACGIDSTAHPLRHWFGTNMYRHSLDLRAVQQAMGHASPTTTAGYAAFSQQTIRDAVAAL